MLAALMALFTWWAAHLSPAPATVAMAAPAAPSVIASKQAPPAPAPQTGMGSARVGPEGQRPHSGAATAAPPPVVAPVEPSCHGIEVWDGEHCVAEQLPAEAAGGDRDPAH